MPAIISPGLDGPGRARRRLPGDSEVYECTEILHMYTVAPWAPNSAMCRPEWRESDLSEWLVWPFAFKSLFECCNCLVHGWMASNPSSSNEICNTAPVKYHD